MDNQKNLIESLNTSQILVGLDLGTKTLGVAVSDRLKIIASPLSTIQRNGTKKDLLKLQEILNNYEIGGFVMGLPLSFDNSEISLPFLVISLLAMTLVVWRHRENIVRLIKGKEPKIGHS